MKNTKDIMEIAYSEGPQAKVNKVKQVAKVKAKKQAYTPSSNAIAIVAPNIKKSSRNVLVERLDSGLVASVPVTHVHKHKGKWYFDELGVLFSSVNWL